MNGSIHIGSAARSPRLDEAAVRDPRRLLLSCACATLMQLAGTAWADSSSGVDTVLGNALNPGRPAILPPYDPDYLLAKHTPSGRPYGIPYASPIESRTTADGWVYRAFVEVGGLFGDGNEKAALFRMYKDLSNGFLINSFDVQMEKPDSARFFEAEGAGVARKDQVYGVQFGRYNDWRVKIFYNETPHVFTSTYRSLWDGVGTGNLTLKPGTQLVAGGANVATGTVSQNIRTALANTPDSELSLVRKKGGIRYDITVSDAWKLYANYTQEKREGARPFGAVWGGGGGGGNVEIPESIDYTTHEVQLGARYRDTRQSFNVQASASFFRNNIDTMSFDNPLTVALNGVNGLTSGTFTQGRYDLAPDNEFYQLRGEYARSFPDFYRSRFTAVVSSSTSRQNDALIAPTLFPLTGGTNAATGTPLANQWNTTSALSQPTAGAKIDLQLVDLGWSSRPIEALNVTGKVRYYETRNQTSYWSCNPLTGEWGRIINEGTGSVVVGANPTPGNNPAGTPLGAYNTAGCSLAAAQALNIVPNTGNAPIGSIPFDYRQTNYKLSGDYRLGKASNVIGTYERENFDRDHRERDRTWEDKYRLEYTNRGFESASLRGSYEYDQRRGSDYNVNPYRDFYSASLGPDPTANGTNVATWIRNIASLRKFDLADRNNHVLNGMFNFSLGPGLDGAASGQWRDSDYPDSQFGRIDHERRGSLSLDLNYQPHAQLNVYGFYSHQIGKMKQGGIQMDSCVIGTAGVTAANFESFCATAGGPLYPLNRAWYVNSDDTNDVLGLGGRYSFSRALLDLNYTLSNGRTKITYQYGDGLGLSPTQSALAGNGFSDLTFRQNVLEASLLVPISATISTRFYYRYEDGKVRDWHYDGVAVNPVPANGAVYLDAGPQDYRVNLFGVFLRVSL